VGGGSENKASGKLASVTGGRDNKASGNYAAVVAGWGNHASGDAAAVSGGWNNEATEWVSSVSGGRNASRQFGPRGSRLSAQSLLAGGRFVAGRLLRHSCVCKIPVRISMNFTFPSNTAAHQATWCELEIVDRRSCLANPCAKCTSAAVPDAGGACHFALT